MDQLTGQDAAFLYVENDALKSHFTMVAIYDQSTVPGGSLRYQDVLRYFEDRIRGMPVFRRKLYRVPLELDAPYFIDDDQFHIEAHVRHIALPEPGDWRQFCILASQIHAQPIDMSRPLWDMTIIGGLDNIEGLPAGAFAILTRLHHAVADGTTARGILTALHHAEGEEPPPMRPAARCLPPSTIEMAARALTHNARQVAGLAPRLLGILPGAGPVLADVARGTLEKALGRVGDENLEIADGTKVPATTFNGDMEYRRVFQVTSYPLSDIKRIRSLAEGATLNDAVLAVIGGGMRRYLSAIGEKAGVDLHALCPINLRADKLSNASQLGNSISLMQINLGTRVIEPAARMSRVVEATSRAKLRQKASTAKEIIALSRDAPNVLLASASRLAAAAAFRAGSAVRLSNCIITNVPGPQEPLYFMGARLVTFTGIGPVASGSGPTFIVTSYLGRLSVAFTACPSWISDPQLMVRCLDESHDEMLAAVGRPSRPARAKSRTTVRTRTVATRKAHKSAGQRVVGKRRARR